MDLQNKFVNEMEEIPYLRTGTAILKRVRMPLSNGRSIETLIAWNVETLRQDFGKDYIAKLPKYDGFCTVPSHTDYRREIHGYLNRYEPISTVPAEGEFPHIREFLAHIFGEQAELGYETTCNYFTCGRSNGCRSCCWYRRSATPEKRPF